MLRPSLSITRFLLSKLLLLFGASLVATGSFAQSLLITDCPGFTQAVPSVDPGSLSKVEFTVADAAGKAAEGVEVTLTNTATGEVTTAVAKNGLVAFENVTAGTFSVSSSATGVTVGSASITSSVGAVAAGGAVAGAGAATGGAVAGATQVAEDVGITDSSSSDPDPSDGSDGSGGAGDSGSGGGAGAGDGTTPGSEDSEAGDLPGPGDGTGTDDTRHRTRRRL